MDLRPNSDEYPAFYHTYVSLLPETDILNVLSTQSRELERIVSTVPRERETYRYAPGKWSIRQVFGHMTDAERVFGYRAFCISRGEQKPLPGFDENTYVANGDSDHRPLAELMAEFAAVRAVNLGVLTHVPDESWRLMGNANGAPVSLRAIAFILAGHVRHHVAGLKKNYAIALA